MSSGTKIAKFHDVFFIGFCLMMSGIPSIWNLGLAFGFWEFFTCALIISIGYLCLTFCLAEMTSILPFSGGSYGFARVSMGKYVGFVIGCFDSMTNTFYALLLVQFVCMSIVDFMDHSIPPHSEPVQWLIMYIVCLSLMIGMGKWSFTFVTVLGVIMLCTCVGYVLCTSKHVDFSKYVLKEDTNLLFDGQMAGFLKCLPIANWLYLGPDMMCLVCDDTDNAQLVVPRCIVYCMVAVIVISLSIIVTASSQSPGFEVLATMPFPLDPGISAALGVPYRCASFFMLPLSFAGLYCLTYIAGRQMCAMARSRLLPYVFTLTTKDNAPYVSLIVSALCGYCILLGFYYSVEDYTAALNQVYYASLMCTISIYLVSCMSFILFRLRYSSLARRFTNKFGIVSALIAMSVFGLSFVGAAGYSINSSLPPKVYFGFIGVVSAYYFLIARRRQTFSPEEKSVMLKAYVLKENSKHKTVYDKARRMLKHARSTPTTRRIACDAPTTRRVACDEPEVVLGGLTAHGMKAKSSSGKDKSQPVYTPTNMVAAFSASADAAMTQQQSLVLFDLEGEEETFAYDHDHHLHGEEVPHEMRTQQTLHSHGDREERHKEGWISSVLRKSASGSYRLAPVPSE